MTAAIQLSSDTSLTDDILVHLEQQLASARRLLAIVLEQAAAIRRRAIRQVVTTAGQLQAEMHRRELLEHERAQLLSRAAHQLHCSPEALGFSSVRELMDVESAQIATSATAELSGLLTEISREHELNRSLMAQELSFLDHLLGLAGGTGGYGAGTGAGLGTSGGRRRPATMRTRVFDLEA